MQESPVDFKIYAVHSFCFDHVVELYVARVCTVHPRLPVLKLSLQTPCKVASDIPKYIAHKIPLLEA